MILNSQIQKKIDSFLPKTSNINFCFLVYFLMTLLLMTAKGPLYFFAYLILFIVLLAYFYQDLSISLFHVFMLTLLIGDPHFFSEKIPLQDFVFYKLPITSFLPVEVTYASVIFVFFIISLYGVKKKASLKKYLNRSFLSSFFILLIMIVLINAGQFLGEYRMRFFWPTFHFIQILLVYPATLIFLIQRSGEAKSIQKIKNLFFSFVLYTLSFEGFLSAIQFYKKSALSINFEKFFSYDMVKAPESDLFRSSGSFAHPNFLGSVLSMLLPIACFLFFSNLHQKNYYKKYYTRLITVSIFLGLLGLVLSFNRWVWITTFLGFLGVVYIERDSFKKILIKIKLRLSTGRVIALIFLSVPIVSLVIFSRFQKISTFTGRFEVAQSYLTIINKSPWWGVGSEMSLYDLTPYIYNYDNYVYSIKGAHNTLLLVVADYGLLAGGMFILFLLNILLTIYTFREQILYQKNKKMLFFLATGVLIYMLNMLVYPLYSFEHSIEIFFVVTAFFYFFLATGDSGQSNEKK